MLAIAGGAGGAGKTTTALGLARALPDRVVVADADVDMPDLHHLAGLGRDQTLAAVADGRDPGVVARAWPGADGVAVVPAPTGDDAVVPGLDRLRGTADAVLVDCPGGAGPDAAAPLRAADAALLVTTAEPRALRDATKTAATARALGTAVAGAVLTRARRAPDGLVALLDCPALGAVPDVDPPVLPDPDARGAYRRIARQLIRDSACQEI